MLHIEFYRSCLGNMLKPRDDDKEGPAFLGKVVLGIAGDISERFCSGIEKMRADGELTPTGLRRKTRELSTSLLNELGSKMFIVERILSAYWTQKNAVENSMRAVDPILAVSRMELRQHLKSLEIHNRVQLFDEAISRNDKNVVEAFLENHAVYKLLPQEKFEAGRMNWLKKSNPELGLAWQEAASAAPLCSNVIRNVAHDLCRYQPIEHEFVQPIFSKLPADDLGYSEPKGTDALLLTSSAMPEEISEKVIEPEPKKRYSV